MGDHQDQYAVENDNQQYLVEIVLQKLFPRHLVKDITDSNPDNSVADTLAVPACTSLNPSIRLADREVATVFGSSRPARSTPESAAASLSLNNLGWWRGLNRECDIGRQCCCYCERIRREVTELPANLRPAVNNHLADHGSRAVKIVRHHTGFSR